MTSLFERFQNEEELGPGARHWTGNDENGNHHHSPIRLNQKTLDIHLQWKAADGAPAAEVGCFRLNLPRLLECGYIRKEGADQIRLRFVHDDDGCVYIQTRNDGPRLLMGKVSLT